MSALQDQLTKRLGGPVELKVTQDVLDMGQFQEVRPRMDVPSEPAAMTPTSDASGPLILEISLKDDDEEGIEAASLSAGDLVQVQITDRRDIARYLARVFGSGDGEQTEEPGPFAAPIEAIESEGGEVTLRVRLSAAVCGDASVAEQTKIRAVRRGGQPSSWWKRIFGGG